MIPFGRFSALTLAALALAGALWAHPAISEEAKAAADGPGRGDLAGFVATPQTEAGDNRAFLIAPDGTWFLATSPTASVIRLIDIKSGITLRYLTSPGLHIAALSISSDSKIVFARDENGGVVAWTAESGQSVDAGPPPAWREIKRLSLTYDGNDENFRITREQLSQDHLLAHFPQLKPYDQVTFNPSQDYALIQIGPPDWRAYQIWNLKQDRSELFFRLGSHACGYHPFAFDYDGKHLVVGNSGGESDHAHLDFTAFRIAYSGPDNGPKQADATQILDDRCAGASGDLDAEFSISPDARFIIRSGGMPGSPDWMAWDLASGDKIVDGHPDGLVAASADGTFAVVHDFKADASPPSQLMTVYRRGRQRTFELPPGMRTDHWRPLVLSSNGRWIASHVGETVGVWSSSDGKLLRQYSIGRQGGDSRLLQVSAQGDPLIVNDREGAVFTNGTWQFIRSDRSETDEIIVPLTPDYHPHCGAWFCDRVIARLGVVARRPVDDRVARIRRELLSGDGRFAVIHQSGQDGDFKGSDIVDLRDGHVVLHVSQPVLRFASDSRSFVASDLTLNGNGFIKYSLVTGKRVWTTIPSPYGDGFYMLLADGRVRLSRDRQVELYLVKGFEVRRVDAATAKQFLGLPDR